MVRARAGLWLLLALSCGARTGLLADSEADPAGNEGGSAGAQGRATAGRAGSNDGGRAGGGGAAGRAASGGGNAAGAGRGGFGAAGGVAGGAGRGGFGGTAGGGAGHGGTGGFAGGAGRGGFGGGGGGFGGGAFGGGGAPPLRTECELSGDDPRVDGIRPDEVASLDASDFVRGDVKSYHWALQAEDCDAVVQDAEFILEGANSRVVKFQPSRPAFYHFTLEVTGFAGDHASCKLEVPVQGVGMRVELCWDTSTTTDLDLYLHTPFNREPWFSPGTATVFDGIDDTTCNTSDCAAVLRDKARVDWGYADSRLDACSTPSFEGFANLGRCPNPRAADDNNQQIASGTTERMQLDNPREGETFRVMAQNFSNLPARPHVFVYCGGQRAGAFDAPTLPSNFVGDSYSSFGVTWRAADVTAHVDASGKVSCSALPVPGDAITIDDAKF